MMVSEDILHRVIDHSPAAELPAQAGRYTLYVSHSCPFAHRVIIARQLMGLQDVIGMIELAPVLPASGIGWHFDETYPDILNGWQRLKQAYDLTFQSDYQGSQSEPILWDSVSQSIVSNESLDIMRMLIDVFNEYAIDDAPDLRPGADLSNIEVLTGHINDNLSSLVYSAHFCEDDAERQLQMDTIFQTMDELENILNEKRYLRGDRLTECDLVLFPTLTRFESVYEPLFHVDRKSFTQYPRLMDYMKDVAITFQLEDTVRFNINIESYYQSPMLNPENIAPPEQVTPVLTRG